MIQKKEINFPRGIKNNDKDLIIFPNRLDSCSYPSYLGQTSILPYHVPFRALTNQDYGNLLVAGKTMAQTFHAQVRLFCTN